MGAPSAAGVGLAKDAAWGRLNIVISASFPLVAVNLAGADVGSLSHRGKKPLLSSKN